MAKKLSEKRKKWIERTIANDRSYKVFLYNRFFFFLLSVLAQVVGYCIVWWLLVYDSAAAIVLQTIVFALEIIFLLHLINKYDRVSTKLSWIILILIAPVFGVPMYLVNGRGRPTRKMNKKIKKSKADLEKIGLDLLDKTCLPLDDRGDGVSYYLANTAKYPAFSDGKVTYYPSGEEMFPAMKEALLKAEKFIFLEYFIIAHGKMWNEILKILLEKAEAGVKIRIIYDDFGCMMTLPPRYEQYLEGLHENIKCMTFNTVVPFFAVRMNNRDHRKILIVDGKVAFTGGINLADEYIAEKRRFGYWKDTGVRITGGAVNSFTYMFVYFWNAFRKDKEAIEEYWVKPTGAEALQRTGVRIQPYDDSPLDGISTGEATYANVIQCAKRYVYVFTPYLVLDDHLRMLLAQAALRGVDVRIVTPGIPDKKMTYRLTRANYEPLLKAGVKIYEYTPGFIHAKSMVCDDECAIVGTINLDYRSLYFHFENAVYFSGCEAVADVKRDAEETFAVSKLCTEKNVKRGLIGRLVDAVLRVFETLI